MGRGFVLYFHNEDVELWVATCRVGAGIAHKCRGRSKFRPLRRRRMQASEHRQSKGQNGLSACGVWGINPLSEQIPHLVVVSVLRCLIATR